MKKYTSQICLAIAILASVYSHKEAATFLHFLIGSLLVFACLGGLARCVKNISTLKISLRVLRLLYILLLSGIIYLLWIISSTSGMHSSYCYNLVAQYPLTRSIKVHCNQPPWYTTVIGGEEARKKLLNHCLHRKTQFYEDHPDYCDVYKKADPHKDWTINNP